MRYDRIDYFWHTLMHELGHVKNQDGLGNGNASIDTNMGEPISEQPEYERQIDLHAAQALIAQDQLEDFIVRNGPIFSNKSIRGFASRIGIHPGIVVGQLQHRGELEHSNFRRLLVPVRDFVTGAAITDGWGRPVPLVSY